MIINSRKNKALRNIIFSLLLEFVSIFSSFILPKLIIRTYGSDTNGLINSISAFIGYISLLQTGVGSVIIASLYKPLAKQDNNRLSIIVCTAEKFFKKIAYLSIFYVVILCFVYPFLSNESFSSYFTIELILIIGTSTFAQYFFGITYQMVLDADQSSYIYSIVQILTVLLNLLTSYILIIEGVSIQIVKLVSSLWYIARPLFLCVYCRKKYKINTTAKVDNSFIKQRWDGFGQGLAYFLHSKTDFFVLTIFSSFTNVSIYSVYSLIVTGLSTFINCIDQAVKSAFGNIIANNEKELLKRRFNTYQKMLGMVVVAVFSTAGVTIFKFIEVYSSGINDANYINIKFGLLLVFAEFVYCLRMPYNSLIVAAGHFRQTNVGAYVEAGINLTLSCILVYKYGLIGVAIGTAVAMIFRTIYFIIYLSKNIIEFSIKSQFFQLFVNILCFCVLIFCWGFINIEISNYFEWFIYAGIVFLTSCVIVLIFYFIFYKKSVLEMFKIIFRRN